MADESRTLKDLLLSAMLRTGLASFANGVAELNPQDSTRAQFLAAFNRAGRRFTLERMWTWRSQRLRVEVNPDGTAPLAVRPPKPTDNAPEPVASPWRYQLDASVVGTGADSSHWEDAGKSGVMMLYAPSLVVAAQANNPDARGNPVHFALEKTRESSGYLNNPQLSARPTTHLLLYPTPHRAMVVDISVRLSFVDLVDLNEAPPWPDVCDDAVVTLTVAMFLEGGAIPREGLSRDSAMADYREELAKLVKEDKADRSVAQSPRSAIVGLNRQVIPTYLGNPL